jgi:DUF4097 and DUF4098 domain-containing protein YvlB
MFSGKILILFAATMLVGCGAFNFASPFTAEEVVAKSFSTAKSPRIEIDTFNGSIDVVTAGDDSVKAKVTKHAGGSTQEAAENELENIDVIMEQDGDTVRITAKVVDGKPIGSRGAAVELEVPPGSVLQLSTSNGKVTAAGRTGDVTAHSSNGPIHVKESKGKLDLSTSNGAIVVQGGSGRLDLKTSNGNIEIHSDHCLMHAGTTNGSIQFNGEPADGENSLHTSNGRIAVHMPADARFHIDAQTSNGSITNEFTLDRTEDQSRTSLRGTVGEAPKTTLQLRTTNGSIEIHPQK